MKCPSCGKEKAIIDGVLGVLPGKKCRKKESKLRKPKIGYEMTTDSIRSQRKEYRKDILQPFHNGVLSKEYVDEYGTSGIEVTDKEVEKAEYTYKGTPGWWNRDKSKGGRKNAK